MAKSSAKGAVEVPEPLGKSLSSPAASDKDSTSPQHRRERFKAWLERPRHLSWSKLTSSSSLDASSQTQTDGDDRRSEDGSASTGLASGNKPEASSAARSGQSTANVSHSTPRDGNARTGARKDSKAALAIAVPIADLWNEAYKMLREKEPKLINKYDEEISLHVLTIVGVAISGIGKVQRREQMKILVRQKLKEDEDGKWKSHLETTALRFETWLDMLLVSLIGERSSLDLP